MSGMRALIIPMLFGLFSIYSDLVVRITLSSYGPGGAELACQNYLLDFEEILRGKLFTHGHGQNRRGAPSPPSTAKN